MPRLVWAATTIGTTPFGSGLRAGRAVEMQWRLAMVRTSMVRGFDAERLDQGKGTSPQVDDRAFLGDDCVAVELGHLWATWPEVGRQ